MYVIFQSAILISALQNVFTHVFLAVVVSLMHSSAYSLSPLPQSLRRHSLLGVAEVVVRTTDGTREARWRRRSPSPVERGEGEEGVAIGHDCPLVTRQVVESD